MEEESNLLDFQKPSIQNVFTHLASTSGVSTLSKCDEEMLDRKEVCTMSEETKEWDGTVQYAKHISSYTYPLTCIPTTFWSERQTVRCALCANVYKDTYPIPVPVGFHLQNKRFEVRAITCSLSCCIRYSMSHKDTMIATSIRTFMFMLLYKWNPLETKLRPGPERIQQGQFWTGAKTDSRCVSSSAFRVCPSEVTIPSGYSICWRNVRLYGVFVPYTFTTAMDRIHEKTSAPPPHIEKTTQISALAPSPRKTS